MMEESSRGTRRVILEASEPTWKPSGKPLDPPGGHLGSQTTLGVKYAKTLVFFCRKWRDRPFRVDGSDATLTISAACAQKLIAAAPEIAAATPGQWEIHRQNPYSRKLFGEYILIYTR